MKAYLTPTVNEPGPNSPSSSVLLTAGALGLIATLVAAVLPVLVGAWQSQFGFTAGQAGWLASAELFTQVAGTVLFIWADRALSLRRGAVFGLAFLVLGNLASARSQAFGLLLVSRMIAGAGGGVVRALSMQCLARARNPGRAFAMYASGQVALAASLTAATPHILVTAGLHAPFMLLAVLCGAAIALSPLLPTTPRVREPTSTTFFLPPAASWAIGALFIFFVGQATVWTFLAPIGQQQGMTPAVVSGTLAWLNIAGLLGTLGAGALAGRINPLITIACLAVVTLTAVVVIFHAHSPTVFALSACSYYFAWCASFPFQFAIIARVDPTGAAGAAAPAVDGLGLACGAALAGSLIARYGILITGGLCGVASVIAIACYTAACTLNKRSPRHGDHDFHQCAHIRRSQ